VPCKSTKLALQITTDFRFDGEYFSTRRQIMMKQFLQKILSWRWDGWRISSVSRSCSCRSSGDRSSRWNRGRSFQR